MATESKAKSASGRVKSLNTALLLLSEFLSNDHELGVADLAERTGMPKGQVSKILATFRDHQFLRQDAATRRYSVGIKTYILGSRFASQDRLTRFALPMMRELSHETGHSVRLSVMDGDRVVYLMGMEGEAFIDTGWRAGTYLPLHSTSAGRIVLAFMDPARADKLIDSLPMERLTAETISDAAKLRKIVAEVRKQGFSAQRGETTAGLATVAVPVLGEKQAIVGVLGLAFPTHAVAASKEKSLIALLHRSARVLSQRMGCAVYMFGGEDRAAPVRTRVRSL